MAELTPPPVRRIALDADPTVIPPEEAINGNGHASAVRRPEAPRPGTVLERMRVEELSVAYGSKLAVNRVSIEVNRGEVLALIGPSGCGKTTLLRSLNRLVDGTASAARSGRILLDGNDIDFIDVTQLRRQVGMVFQQPNPFPMSIFDNIAYGLRERGSRKPSKRALEPAVHSALHRAGLLEEVKDDLQHPALRLSGGQQQRLCIARTIAVQPEVILMDEPCSALDAEGIERIELLLQELRKTYTILIVTHNMAQARRASDECAFMLLGRIVEHDKTLNVFLNPREKETEMYVTGRYG